MRLENCTDITNLHTFESIANPAQAIMPQLHNLFQANIAQFMEYLASVKTPEKWNRYIEALVGLKIAGIEIPAEYLPTSRETTAEILSHGLDGSFGIDYAPILYTIAFPQLTKSIAESNDWARTLNGHLRSTIRTAHLDRALLYLTSLRLWGSPEGILKDHHRRGISVQFEIALQNKFATHLITYLAQIRMTDSPLFAEMVEQPIDWQLLYDKIAEYFSYGEYDNFLSLYGYMLVISATAIEINAEGLHLTHASSDANLVPNDLYI